MTNVLIVEDERLVQQLFAKYIESAFDRYFLCDTITDARNTILICEKMKIDLILMDCCTANNSSGLDAAKSVKKRFPHIKVIIVTSAPEFRFIEKAKDAGADSFWYKDVSQDDLLLVMDKTMNGESIFPSSTPKVIIGDATSYDFTKTELVVLLYLAEGLSSKSIAQKMFISVDTVNTHIKHLKDKTGCTSKTQIAVLAAKSKLVLPEY